MISHVFISHSDKDKTFAQMLLSALEERGTRCWIAPRDIPPGGSYADAIMRAIEECSCFILVYTNHSNTSPHVLREVERALKFERNIIPVRFDHSEPSRSLDYLLATVQWISIDTAATKVAVHRAAEQIAACVAPETTSTVASAPRLIARPQIPAAVPPKKSGPLKFVLLGAVIVLLIAAAVLFGRFVRPQRQMKPIAEGTPTPAATPLIPKPGPLPSASPALVEQTPPTTPPPLARTPEVAWAVQQSPTATPESGAQQALRRYFGYFAERDPTAAYNLLTSGFRSAFSYKKYSAMFSSTREIKLMETKVLNESKRAATVSVTFDEMDADYRHVYWQGPVELELENGEWRIKAMNQLKEIPLPDGMAGRPALNVATSAPARTPEKRWEKPHIYLQLANQSQMKAAGDLKRRLTQSGYEVVEVQTASGNVDIPSETSEIRYFTPGDADEALRLANEMRPFFGSTGVIAYLPEGMPYVSHARQYEVWFSSAFH